MAGPQFAHIQTWSRKPNKVGRSIEQIIGEGTRDPTYSQHVEEAKVPRILKGDPASFQAEHDAHVASRATVARLADGKERRRAIRTDRHTMASIVMSYPVPYAAITSDEARAKLKAWETRNLEWLTKTYGDQVRVVFAHDDETHPHLHAWLLPDDPGADATSLHPGKVAKREAEANAKAAGLPARAAVSAGNGALRQAMTFWQDAYHEAVGAPEGLTRSGPLRRRLSRGQWQAEKATAAANAAALLRATEADRISAEKVAAVQAEASALRAKVAAEARAHAAAFSALANEIEAGTLFYDENGMAVATDIKAIEAGSPHIDPAVYAALKASDTITARMADADAHLAAAKEQRQQAILARADAEEAKVEAADLLKTLRGLVGRVKAWLSRPDLPHEARADADRLAKDAMAILSPEEPSEESDRCPGL